MLLQRHYLKNFFKLFGIILFGLVLIIGLFDLVELFDKFSDDHPPVGFVLEFWMLGMPRYLVYLMPIATLLSGMFTVGSASRNRELVIFMSAGGRAKRLLMPFVLTGIMLSLSSFAIEEMISPLLSDRAARIMAKISGKTNLSVANVGGTTWMRTDDDHLVRMELYEPETDTFRGISVYKMNDEGIKEIITARSARYQPQRKGWTLYDASLYETGAGLQRSWDELPFDSINPPSDLSSVHKEPYEMSMFELNHHINRLKESGFSNLRLEVELHSKLSYPFVNLIVLVLGVSVAASRTIGGLFAAAFSLLITLSYWLGYTLSLTMGFAGIVPPVIAVWAMPVLFGCFSTWLYTRIAE